METLKPPAMTSVLPLLLFLGATLAADRLGTYNVNPDSVTVSGLSAGAAFSTQIHVALSGTIKGAATFAGVPYYCAQGSSLLITTCMLTPQFVDVQDMIQQADEYSNGGQIDSTQNLNGQRVFLWHGGFDFTVDPGASDLIERFYLNYASEVGYETTGVAGHCVPTENYGSACSLTVSPFINDCDYSGAFQALNWLYRGQLTEPDASVTPSTILEYDQSEFSGGSDYFDPAGGFLYVPENCSNMNVCALHVALHGCSQGREFVQDRYARHAGYLEVAEANDIILLFPQIISDGLFGDNPLGCFDWWAYEGENYATKNGLQVSAIKSMIDRVLGNVV